MTGQRECPGMRLLIAKGLLNTKEKGQPAGSEDISQRRWHLGGPDSAVKGGKQPVLRRHLQISGERPGQQPAAGRSDASGGEGGERLRREVSG